MAISVFTCTLKLGNTCCLTTLHNLCNVTLFTKEFAVAKLWISQATFSCLGGNLFEFVNDGLNRQTCITTGSKGVHRNIGW